MGKLSKLRRLERVMRGQLSYFELADGSRYFYEPEKAWTELFLHGSKCLEADHRSAQRPEPPAILEAVARAKDRRGAVERILAQDPAPLTAYDLEPLVERGELVPRSFLAGHSYEPSVEPTFRPPYYRF
jgi:hypothetical protein